MKRRGAVSAGPISEDEATSYVKKVIQTKIFYNIIEKTEHYYFQKNKTDDS